MFGRYELGVQVGVVGIVERFVAMVPGEHAFRRSVVIRRLIPKLRTDPAARALFMEEATQSARLVNGKIVQTLELGKVDDELYIATEHVEGIDVLTLLHELTLQKQRIDPPLAVWIAHEVLDALDYAHTLPDDRGVPAPTLHRRISPSTVLLGRQGDVKVAEFGVAGTSEPEAGRSRPPEDYAYMSPEQVLDLPLDARSDVFSVGIVLGELLTGHRLFAGTDDVDLLLQVRSVRLERFAKYGADLDLVLATMVRTALSKEIQHRYQSAGLFRDALSDWLFEHRHRITNKHIAQLVLEISTAARRRPKEAAPAVDPVLIAGVTMSTDHEGPAPQRSGTIEIPKLIPSRTFTPPRTMTTRGVPPASPVVQVPPLKQISTERTGPVARPLDPDPAAPREDWEDFSDARPKYQPRTASEPVTLPSSRTPAPTDPPRLAQPRVSTRGMLHPQRARRVSSTESKPLERPPPEPTSPGSIHAAIETMLHNEPRAMPALATSTATPHVLVTLATIDQPPDDHGDLARIAPLRVLFRLMAGRSTGVLVISTGEVIRHISLRDGNPDGIASNSAADLFGHYLVANQLLSDDEVALAQGTMRHYHDRLGDTLVGLGLLRQPEVVRHQNRHARALVIGVCGWTTGRFAWHRGFESARETFAPEQNGFETLGAGALALPSSVTEKWFSDHRDQKLAPARTRRIDPDRFKVRGIAELFAAIDGTTTVASLAGTATDRLHAVRSLYLLVASELVLPA